MAYGTYDSQWNSEYKPYIIIKEDTESNLEYWVNEHIQHHDYIPMGGVNYDETSNCYIQAMVKIRR